MVKSLKKSAIWLTVLMVLSKLLGIVREICIARQFGTSYIVDAYTISSTFPNILFTLFAQGYSESFIPIIIRTKKNDRQYLFNNTMTFLLLGSMVLTGLSFLFSRWLIYALAPGFDERSAALAEKFLRVIVFAFPIYVSFALLSARISAEEDFFVQNFCNFILVNLVLIASILVSTTDYPQPLAFGFVMSMALALLVLAVYARLRYNVHYRPMVALHDPAFRNLNKMAIPLGVSLMVNELNAVIDRMFSSGLGEGITSSLSYASKIQSILLTLTTAIFLSICYPRLNKCFAERKPGDGMFYAGKAAEIAYYTSIPLTALLIVFAEPIVRLLFERGSFTAESTKHTAVCLRYYSIGILFFSVRAILTQVLAANLKQRLILKNTLYTVAFNIVLNIVLIRLLSYGGLALATSLSGLFAAGLLMHDMRILGLKLFNKNELSDVLKILLGTILCILLSYFCYRIMLPALGAISSTILALGLAFLLYIVASIALRIPIFVWLYQMLPARFQVFHF